MEGAAHDLKVNAEKKVDEVSTGTDMLLLPQRKSAKCEHALLLAQLRF